jgi:hypothetical protein
LFCKNVISHGMDDMIIPLPNTTKMMIQLFEHLEVKSQLIYVDASHEYGDVVFDLQSYFKILDEGGFIFGDDFPWPDVKLAAQTVANEVNRELQSSEFNNLYYIQK